LSILVSDSVFRCARQRHYAHDALAEHGSVAVGLMRVIKQALDRLVMRAIARSLRAWNTARHRIRPSPWAER
jgi:hypothetical protein